MPTPHHLLPQGPLRELLLALYAHGAAVMTSTASTAASERRTALRALRLGYVELVGDEPLARDRAEAGLRMIRVAPGGRTSLGLPEPAPLGDRDPIEVLRAGVSILMGAKAFPLRACPEGWAGRPLLAAADYHVRGCCPDELSAIAKYASEQGVPCVSVIDHDGRDGWTLIGFEIPEFGGTP